jgi:hypothetical protein
LAGFGADVEEETRPIGRRPVATFMSERGSNMQRTNTVPGGRSMAKIIEFYVPQEFMKRPKSSGKRGQVIEFVIRPKKSA